MAIHNIKYVGISMELFRRIYNSRCSYDCLYSNVKSGRMKYWAKFFQDK